MKTIVFFILFLGFRASAQTHSLKKVLSCKGTVSSFESIDVYQISNKKLLVLVNGPGFLTARFKLSISTLKKNKTQVAINSDAPWMQLVHNKKDKESFVAFNYRSKATSTHSFGQEVNFSDTNYNCL